MISSLEDLFNALNNNCLYIILRNWDNVFDEEIYCSGHEDIDILCDDKEAFFNLTNAYSVHRNRCRDNYIVPCGKTLVRFDVRWVGDGYYPVEWEKQLLKRRVLKQNGIYVPCPEDYFYSLAYHAFFQKRKLSDEYQFKLQNLYKSIGGKESINKGSLFTVLNQYMDENGYFVSIPCDPAVQLNWLNIKKIGYNRDINLIFRRYIFRFNMILSHIFHKIKL